MGATAAIGTVALGTGMSAFGQMRAGKETKAIYDQNAQIADYQAEDALARGRVNEKMMRRQTEQTIGSQRAGLAAQGVDINRGSALETQASAAYLGELDALTIRNNAAKEAWGYRVQAQNLRNQGTIAKRDGTFGAFNTILGSTGSLLLSKYGGGLGRSSTSRTGSAPEMDFNPSTAGQ